MHCSFSHFLVLRKGRRGASSSACNCMRLMLDVPEVCESAINSPSPPPSPSLSPCPSPPTESKYKQTGENTTTQGQTQLNHYCGLSQTGVTNYNWLFGWLYKFGHALQKPHGATLRFQYQGWIMVLIRPFSLRTSTNEDLTCLGSINMIILVAMLSVM